MGRKIYVASSWRNKSLSVVVSRLQNAGHEAYDFRSPTRGEKGFEWSMIDDAYEFWNPDDYLEALEHRYANLGFVDNYSAMRRSDTFLLVLPCGNSAHLELGWACRDPEKETYILLSEEFRPDLMHKLADKIFTSLSSFMSHLDLYQGPGSWRGHIAETTFMLKPPGIA